MKKIIIATILITRLLSNQDIIIGKWDIETENKSFISFIKLIGNKFYFEFDNYKYIKDEKNNERGTWKKEKENVYIIKPLIGIDPFTKYIFDESMKQNLVITRKLNNNCYEAIIENEKIKMCNREKKKGKIKITFIENQKEIEYKKENKENIAIEIFNQE